MNSNLFLILFTVILCGCSTPKKNNTTISEAKFTLNHEQLFEQAGIIGKIQEIPLLKQSLLTNKPNISFNYLNAQVADLGQVFNSRPFVYSSSNIAHTWSSENHFTKEYIGGLGNYRYKKDKEQHEYYIYNLVVKHPGLEVSITIQFFYDIKLNLNREIIFKEFGVVNERVQFLVK
jgi:hypothetical protein